MNIKRKRLILTTISLLILCLSYLATPVAPARAAEAADEDHCANGGVGMPAVVCNDGAWVNGDLNGTKAHYKEGQSVPYRLKLTGISPADGTTVHYVTIA